jgi:hypothetical protein
MKLSAWPTELANGEVMYPWRGVYWRSTLLSGVGPKTTLLGRKRKSTLLQNN